MATVTEVGNSSNQVSTAPLKNTAKNNVKSIEVYNGDGEKVTYGSKQENKVKAGDIYTYKVTTYTVVDKAVIEVDKDEVKWCFWLDKTQDQLSNRSFDIPDITQKEDSNKDFLLSSKAENDSDKAKENYNLISSNAILYAKHIVETIEGKKKVKMEIKFSKWLDGEKVKIEAYIGEPKLNSKYDAVATRTVLAQPEIVDSYWLSKDGEKLEKTGYGEDLYLHLKTLGLYGKTVETLVYEKDWKAEGDDEVQWENNKLKIEERDTNKQFKVGDKEKYKAAQKDENKESEDFYKAIFDFQNRETYDLELYISIGNKEELKLINETNEFGDIILTAQENIVDAYFATVEKEEVIADASMTPILNKKKEKVGDKNTTTKVDKHEKLNDAVIGQKVKLVAECDNINDKEVVFKLFEKSPLLVGKDEPLPIVQDGKEVTEVKAIVRDGYAVTEIEVRPGTAEKRKKWIKKINDSKVNYIRLWFKVGENEISIEKEMFKEQGVKFITHKWNEPIANPQRTKYNYYGVEKPKSSAFGKVRSEETKFHQGLDIFALPGTEIKAGLDGKIVEKRFSNSVGNVVTIEVNNKAEMVNRRLESTYSFEFPGIGAKGEKEKGLNFDLDDDNKMYLRHYHLSKVEVKKGDFVKAGQKIGESGVTGNADKTRAPHLHLEILDTTEYTYQLKDKINPAYFVKLKSIDDAIQDEAVKYKYKKDGTKQKVN